jgi:hypothetical protein
LRTRKIEVAPLNGARRRAGAFLDEDQVRRVDRARRAPWRSSRKIDMLAREIDSLSARLSDRRTIRAGAP